MPYGFNEDKSIYDLDTVTPMKQLWAGLWHMVANQTVTPSEKLSEQKNGWILVWSGYNNGVATNTDYAYQVIPKWHGQGAMSGRGVGFSLASGSRNGFKYLYVRDSSITGYDPNSQAETVGGVSRVNYYWVLVAVLGF